MATEIRFAFAVNGGVSLAIWIGGVVDEVVRLVDGGRRAAGGTTKDANPWTALCRELDILPKIDVLAGSSAGGLNAAFLGTAVVHGCADLDPIKQLWLDHGSFDHLLRRPTDSVLVSVLNGDENFLPHIHEAFRLLAKNGTGFADVDPPVVVRLTATALSGRVTAISDGHGEIASADHRTEFVFHTSDFDFANDERAIERLARACRSTASFPGAFEPSDVPVDLYEPQHVTGGLLDGATTSAIPVIDGALLVNLPAQSAIDAIIHQSSRERVERVLALVVPDPGDPGGGSSTKEDGPPRLKDVLSKSILGIPRTQSLTDFVRQLNEHNLEVRSRRSAREAVLAQFALLEPAAAWTSFTALAGALFPAYRAMRVTLTLDRTRLALANYLPPASPAPTAEAMAAAGTADSLVWVPRELGLGGSEWCWGSTLLARLSAVLITWINTVAATAPHDVAQQLYALKGQVSAVRAEGERIAPKRDEFAKRLAGELAVDGSITTAFQRAARRWGSDDAAQAPAAIAALNGQLTVLAGCVADFGDIARPVLNGPDERLVAMRGLLNLHDGARAAEGDLTRLMLCIEVIESTFAGFETRPDQEIRLVQFTSKGAVTIDDRKRSAPVDKLAGVELAHFGAFLKRSWRANDWMWGRLDGAERLVRLLDDLAGNRLTIAGTLEAHTRAVQAQILREELPTVVAEIEADEKLGGRSSDDGRAFCAAVRAVTSAAGAVDLSGVADAKLQELFALQLVGSEKLETEVGSDLAMMTSIAAVATTAAVLRTEGPRLLRGPMRVLGASSSLAWRASRREKRRRLRVVQASLVVLIGLLGLAGIVVDAFTGVDLGALRYVSWVCVVVAPVLALFVVPWLLIWAGRRLLGRQKPHDQTRGAHGARRPPHR